MGKFSHFLALNINISKTVADRPKLLLITNRKSHYELSIDTKIDDLELLVLYGQILSEFLA